MICSKDLLEMAEAFQENGHPQNIYKFLANTDDFYDEMTYRYSVGMHKISQGEYKTSCNCHSLGKPTKIGNVFRCVCSSCGKTCNRCFLKEQIDKENRSPCESCVYLNNETFDCQYTSTQINNRRPRCEVILHENRQEFEEDSEPGIINEE